LIKNGTIVSMDAAIGDLARGDILIVDDRIVEIAPHIAAADAEVIDASDCIVAPGLVHAHIHSWQTALRGIGGDWAGTDYFTFFHESIAPRYTPHDTYIGTLMGAVMQIACGTTTMFDWCHNNATPEHTDAAIDALEESGIRAVFGHGTVKPKPKPGDPHFSHIPHPEGEIRRLRKGRLASDDARVTLAACILGPDYSTLEVCRHDFRMAREYGLLSSAHVWGRPNRLNPRGYHTIAEEGLLGPDHNIVHGNYIPDDELKVIVDHGASATSTAAIELKNHAREPLSGRVQRLGGRPSIGVDSEVSAAGSMFEVMRFALQAQRIYDNIETVRRIENQEDARGAEYVRRNLQTIGTGGSPIEKLSIRTREVLEWGTINNARALRLDHKIGSLAPGKQADVILIRRDTLNMLCAHDPVQAIVFYAHGPDVDTVLIAGKVMKRHGRLTDPALERRCEALRASAARLLEGAPAQTSA
jgi:cytosine/adenosine deaminase-related metal-dependent hydrolase